MKEEAMSEYKGLEHTYRLRCPHCGVVQEFDTDKGLDDIAALLSKASSQSTFDWQRVSGDRIICRACYEAYLKLQADNKRKEDRFFDGR
jgi:hypothetical protein